MAEDRFGRPGLVLAGDKTELRCFTAAHRDDPAYLGWLHDYEVIKTLDLPAYVAAPVPYDEVASYCDRLMTSDTDLFLAMHDKTDGRFVGTVKAGHIRWHAMTADIGIMIGEKEYWGRGVANDALHTLCRYLFDTVKMRRLTAGAMAVNPAMVKVFERLGFRQEGVFRAQDRFEDGYCDHIHLGCFASELKAPA